jgi:hypothetical protein
MTLTRFLKNFGLFRSLAVGSVLLTFSAVSLASDSPLFTLPKICLQIAPPLAWNLSDTSQTFEITASKRDKFGKALLLVTYHYENHSKALPSFTDVLHGIAYIGAPNDDPTADKKVIIELHGNNRGVSYTRNYIKGQWDMSFSMVLDAKTLSGKMDGVKVFLPTDFKTSQQPDRTTIKDMPIVRSVSCN